jgi:hypothetical protein
MVMKRVLFLILFAIFVRAYNLNNILVIEARLYPKIIRLQRGMQNKKNLKIAIIYSTKTLNYALKLSNLLKQEGIKSFLIKKGLKKADAYILTVKKIKPEFLNSLLKQKRIIFTIYPGDLKYAMVGITIGVRILPMINPKLIKKSGIFLNPIIFQVSKVYNAK